MKEEQEQQNNMVGFDKDAFNKCFDARTYKSSVEEAVATATSHGVSSTPTVLINGLKFEGVMPFESLKQIIETELAK